ncbi:MAG TPA: phage major capsid protein, P2 family [Candidatus Sulfotelmatobacter sp.]|jgi:P2 family phage major capsid protein|nr:phage major capsid protein, P2 family [Candidatus Sulfotelmatobacter sp.]
MRNDTRIAFDAYSSHIATLNSVTSAANKFAVSPSVAQTLEDRIQESAAFLQQINIVPVDEQSGQRLGLGSGGPAAGRTDTDTTDRSPRNLVDMTDFIYQCVQTNYDTYVKYPQLDAWAKFKDFQARMRNHVVKQVARDRLMVGWNGVKIEKTTNLATYPLLQDVNKGWLQHIRENAPSRSMNNIKVGAADGADYRSLDSLVFDMNNELLEPWYREDSDIVVLCGSGLVTDKYLGLMNSAATDAPTEKDALATLLANKTIGSKKVLIVPYFPSNALLLTKPTNLSIYFQSGSHRRQIVDEPKRDRVVDYLSDNEAFVIEDFGAVAFVEDILKPKTGGGWE